MKSGLSKNKLIFIVTILSLISFSACKEKKEVCDEYPEECEKLTREWEIELFTVNDIDSLSQLMTQNIYCETYKLEYSYNNYYLIGTDCNGNAPSHEYWGLWAFSGMNHFISFYFFLPERTELFVDKQWSIETLTAEKLWLKTTYNNNNYEIHFNAK